MINIEKLLLLERTLRLVQEYAEAYPKEHVRVKPSPNAFSATEIVFHLADVERLWHDRFVEMQKSNTVQFEAMDPDAKALHGKYNERSISDGMLEWVALRSITYTILKEMDAATFASIGVHPKYGVMDVQRILDVIANHDLQHLEQMKRTLSQVTAI